MQIPANDVANLAEFVEITFSQGTAPTVPELGTLASFGLGVASLTAWRRRK
jgi:hypothetical protein